MRIHTHNDDEELVQPTRGWDRQFEIRADFSQLANILGYAYENDNYDPVWYVRVLGSGDCLLAPNPDWRDDDQEWDDLKRWMIFSRDTRPALLLLQDIKRKLSTMKRSVVIGKSTKLPLPDARRAA